MSEQEDLEKIMSKARKLKELYTRADIEGEKDAAEAAYKSHLKKHGLYDADINPDMNKRFIDATDGEYKDVLLNVILSVNPFTRHSYVNTGIECFLDSEDYNEVIKKYDYFSKLLRVEKELLITSFLSKHKDYFEPDDKANKKWRERRVENDAFNVKKQEKEIIQQEFNRLQAEALLNTDAAKIIIMGGDRLKIAALNQDRVQQLKDILLDAEYVRSHTRIGNYKNF